MVFFILMCLPVIFLAMQVYAALYAVYEPLHRCRLFNETSASLYIPTDNATVSLIPPPKVVPGKGAPTYKFDKCEHYGVNGSRVKCDGWVWDRSTMKNTIIEDAELVCDRQWLQTPSKAMILLGTVVGACIFGYLSDIIGRRKTFLIGIILVNISGFIPVMTKNFWVFFVAKFVSGASFSAVFLPAFVISVELVGPKWRAKFGSLINVFWAIGATTLALIGYLAPYWQTIQLAVTIPTLLFIPYIFFMPESMNWLMAKRRFDEVKKILKRIEKVNKCVIPPEYYATLGTTDSTTENDGPSVSITKLFSNRTLLPWTLIFMFNWLVVSLAYYGTSIIIESLGGNFFVNQAFTSAIEIPANIFALVILDILGRRIPYMFCLISAGISFLVYMVLALTMSVEELTNSSALLLVFFLIGKFGVAACFSIIYIWTAEVFPTLVRTKALGLCSIASKFGTIAAAPIGDFAKNTFEGGWKTGVPMAMFGVTAVVAGALAYLLPETLNRELPLTIEDAVNLKRPRISPDNSKTNDVLLVSVDDSEKIALDIDSAPSSHLNLGITDRSSQMRTE